MNMPPNGWTTDALSNLVTFKTGKLNSNAAVSNGAYPFFTCSQETLRTNTFAFDTECVLLAGNNANGIYPLKYFHGRFDAYQRTYVVTPQDCTRLNTRFLYYSMWPLLEHLQSISTGAATKFLTLTILNGLQLTFPSEPVQRKIAGILSAYDDLIENNTRRIAILEEMAQAIYREWFVHFRFPGHENTLLVDSPLGKIPEGWQVKRLDSICERITSGGTPRTNVNEYWDGDIPWLSSGETGNTFITETEKKITQEGVTNSSTRFARSGCTVIASAGQGKTRGQTSMLCLDCYINQSTIAVTADGKQTTDSFLFFDLVQRYDQFRQISDGSSRGSLTTKLIADLEIILPQPFLIQKFDVLTTPVVKHIENILRKNKILRKTRDLLLPKLISGELDVESLEIDFDEPTFQQPEVEKVIQPPKPQIVSSPTAETGTPYKDDAAILCLLLQELLHLAPDRPNNEFVIQKHMFGLKHLRRHAINSKFVAQKAGPWSQELRHKAVFAAAGFDWLRFDNQGKILLPGRKFTKGVEYAKSLLGEKAALVTEFVQDLSKFGKSGLGKWMTIFKVVCDLHDAGQPITRQNIQTGIDNWPGKRDKNNFSVENVDDTISKMVRQKWFTLQAGS
ncbi:restriction modification system DNA specificity domain protein [Planctopirus limnophila DSM 3776]|uniref:Restriction modification system DNA specificity domain protein n=1 Tax=Planctopirus limnophila (strain ATCC 43296 / DSM 3776 / IFAM 1008 / Mu 290) TaxID=521674 RepID=D5SUK3_PLAL2|nr:restriction endonuclease subunit S [Planctopirus limnophila]ADG67055.1 restriction modification system DNA specificity domain protein [Planctopirus limnophila DSM 3776]